jgi:DNA-binding IclR family transcriptional regulator
MPEASLSVCRIAAVLELFERERRPLSSREIATNLGIPRSSLGTLLKALVGLRWLTIDRRRATYFPGARLARVTGWLQGEAVLDEPLREAVERLRQRTGETASISAVSDLEVEVMHVSSQDVGIQLVVHPGRRMPIWHSGVGTAHLATLADATIRAMHARARRRAAGSGDLSALDSVLSRVRAARAAGVAFADAAVVPGVAAMAIGLPEDIGPRPLVLSVGGPSARVIAAQAAITRELKACVASLGAPVKARPGRRA